jgi:hypothetical protein
VVVGQLESGVRSSVEISQRPTYSHLFCPKVVCLGRLWYTNDADVVVDLDVGV